MSEKAAVHQDQHKPNPSVSIGVPLSRIPCPFVYEDGKPCTGEVSDASGYGPFSTDPTTGEHYQDIRRIRLWCSHKRDHCGARSSRSASQRMLFYPDELPSETLRAVCDQFGL